MRLSWLFRWHSDRGLTPRHVTRFAVEAVGVAPNDLVLDPACGTGGFLVAAFDHVRRTATSAQLDHFKNHNLFGMEHESYVRRSCNREHDLSR